MQEEDLIDKISNFINTDQKESKKILEKAVAGGEITSSEFFEEWFEKRFKPNVVFIGEEGYAKMCIDALKILKTTAATDYGSSRQRDFGQSWADMTRGYLAEYAFVKFLKNNWNIESELGHEQGKLSDFLPTDIHKVKKSNDKELRDPKINIGIKGTKWNGIWFDIPGSQFHHSNIHVLVKVGTGRDHLFAYFKHISVFKDKVLKKGVEVGSLNSNEAQTLYESLPKFTDIPAYIVGFALRDADYSDIPYAGKMGRKNYTITGWKGEMKAGDKDKIKLLEKVPGKIKFEGIGNFAHDSGYLFNTGSLLWNKSDWEKYVINPL